MLLQLIERKLGAHRDAVVDDVQVRLLKVDDLAARGILHVGVANVPFARNRPIEDLGAGRQLVHGQRNAAREDLERRTHAIARYASAYRIEPRRKVVDGGPGSPSFDLPAIWRSVLHGM